MITTIDCLLDNEIDVWFCCLHFEIVLIEIYNYNKYPKKIRSGYNVTDYIEGKYLYVDLLFEISRGTLEYP